MSCLFGAAPSTMAILGVLAVLLVLVATSSADPNGQKKLMPASQYMTGRSNNVGFSRSRKSLQSESDIPVSLPNSYSDLGPNVRASKSYRRPSRRIGMAEEDGEESQPGAHYSNHRVAKHAERNDDTRDVTSQPDISSVISNDSKTRLSERISEIQKRFPNMRNRFGSRLKPGSSNDDDQQNSVEEVEVSVKTREQFSGANARDSSELTSTNLVIPTTERSPAERKRPFVVRRPLRDQHRINAPEAREEEEKSELTVTGDDGLLNNRPSLSNRFRQILNRRNENVEDGGAKIDFDASRVNSPQRHHPSEARSDPSNSFTGLDERRNNPPGDIRNNRGREGVRKRPDHNDGTRTSARSYNELKTTSFSTNKFEYPRKTLQEEASKEVNSDDLNKENSYAGNENRDPERKFPIRNPPQEQTPDEKLPNHQEVSQPPATNINRDASHADHQDNASLNPSISDNGRNWYPNNPNEHVEKPSLDAGYGQFERQEENLHVGEEHEILLPSNDGIYRDDLQKFTSSPREQNERARHPYYARNRNPAERPDTFDVPKRQERVGMNRDNTQNHFEIPDLSLTTHGPNRITPEPFSQRTHPTSSPPSQPPSRGGQRPKLYRNSNVLQNHISTGYQQYNHHSSSPNQKQGHEWAFDPKWSVSDGPFVTDRTPFTSGPVVSTTENFLMEPTKVPGSPHLVARNEFPYNFWRPANANRENEGIYPKSRQSEFSDLEPEFKEVPDYLFQVGAGPVSVPEDLVRNTYEMVTAAPSFDLMNNPFEPQNKQFNSMPDIQEMESVNALGNPHRRPQRPNRNRRPNQRNNPGRNNPFSSIRNMMNPGQETRILGTRPSMRPNGPEANGHSGRPNFGGNGEGSSFRLKLNPIIPNNIREPFRPNPSVLPSGRPGHRQPSSLATTLVPAHLNNSPGAIGFAHFTHQPDNYESHGPPSGDQSNNNLHQRLDNQVNSEKDQYSRDERWKTPNQESIIEEPEDQPVQAHFQQPLRPPQGANFKVPLPRFNNFRRANGGRQRSPERPHHARNPPARNHPGNGNKFLVREPNWVRDISQDLSMYDRTVIKAVNPHARYTTTHGPALATRSHFDVKQIDVERPEGPKTLHAASLGTPHVINLGNREGPVDHFLQNHQFQYGADPADEQERQHLVRPNQFEPQQNIEHYRVRIPRPRPQQAYTLAPRPQRPQHNQIRQEPQQQSIWSALTNFDFSFLNPFSGYNNPESEYTNDVDRVATAAAAAAAIPASVLVPGGLAVLGAGLSLFYFNFVWSPTPVVKARLVDMIMKGTHASVLTEEQQRAIGDVTKVYSALSDMGAKMSGPEEAELSSEHKESLMSQDCKNRLVCQTYHEFADLLEVTKGAATLFGGALKRLDQDLLLEYFLAADRGHHLASSGTCAAYYPSCELPELSIRGALREIAGLPILDTVPDNSLDGVVAEDEGRSLGEGLRKRKPGNSLRRVGLPTSEPLTSEETTEVTSEAWTTLADDVGTTSPEILTSSSSKRDLTTQSSVDEKKL